MKLGRQPIGDDEKFPSGCCQKTWNFHPFSLKRHVLVCIYEILRSRENFFATASGWSSIISLSNHTTFGQTQTRLTVPFRKAARIMIQALSSWNQLQNSRNNIL